jgi:pyruvate kinase
VERKTKIVATLGPACATYEGIRELVRSGMDVARLNFSHGDFATHRQLAAWVRAAALEEGRCVALLQDIQGPKIRVGTFPGGSMELVTGSEVLLVQGGPEARPGTVPIDYDFLLQDIQPGEDVLLADGHIRLKVVAREGDGLLAEVILGGTLGDHKGAAFPQSELRTPSVTEKDRRDLAFGRELEVDLVAASFVRSAADVREVAELAGGETPVVAKIELAAGYQRLDEILDVAPAIMVARGDLGVQLPLEKIPLIQLDILSRSNAAGALVITATEMLESMTHAWRPTRAEVTDVASAVLAGTDAVMLSGETATGKFPARAVQVMDIICREIEGSMGPSPHRRLSIDNHGDSFPSAAAGAAVEAAETLGIQTIVVFTETGNTARLLSKYRPHARILAFTPELRTMARMSLYWGVRSFRYDRFDSTDDMILFAERRLLEMGICAPGEAVVMLAGVPPNERQSTNLMKLHRIKGA